MPGNPGERERSWITLPECFSHWFSLTHLEKKNPNSDQWDLSSTKRLEFKSLTLSFLHCWNVCEKDNHKLLLKCYSRADLVILLLLSKREKKKRGFILWESISPLKKVEMFVLQRSERENQSSCNCGSVLVIQTMAEIGQWTYRN